MQLGDREPANRRSEAVVPFLSRPRNNNPLYNVSCTTDRRNEPQRAQTAQPCGYANISFARYAESNNPEREEQIKKGLEQRFEVFCFSFERVSYTGKKYFEPKFQDRVDRPRSKKKLQIFFYLVAVLELFTLIGEKYCSIESFSKIGSTS